MTASASSGFDFSYNKRTMDRGNGAFLALVAVPRINNVRVLNTLDSSTLALVESEILVRLAVPNLITATHYATVWVYSKRWYLTVVS
jgi:hypothetical protein